MRRIHKLIQFRFKQANLLDFEIVQHAVGAGIDDDHLFFNRKRLVLWLLQNLNQPFAAIQLGLRRFVQLGAKQRKGGQFAVLRQIQAKRAGHLAHGLDLRAAARRG